MKLNYTPQLSDVIAIAIGVSMALIITGGVPLGTDDEQTTGLNSIDVIDLDILETANGRMQSYEKVYALYKDYYIPPKEKSTPSGEQGKDRLANEKDTIEVDNRLYQLQATFIAEQAMAVIMIKNQKGKLEDTVLLKRGERIGRYIISQVNRTEVVLVSEDNQQPLFLKLFERESSK